MNSSLRHLINGRLGDKGQMSFCSNAHESCYEQSLVTTIDIVLLLNTYG